MAEAAARTIQEQEPRDHLHAVDSPAHRSKFAAIDHRVARVLGPQRASANIYGYLASAWYEFASPDALKSIGEKLKRAKTPGDWVDVTYAELMTFTGTRAKASIIRWIRILAEERHECPWERCAEEHPLVVVQRVGRSRPNRYRRWKCGEDTLVIRRRVRSPKLQAIARARVGAGSFLNGHPAQPDGVKSYDETSRIDVPLPLGMSDEPEVKSHDETSKNTTPTSYEVSSALEVKSQDKASGSLLMRPSEASPEGLQKSYSKASLRVNSLNISQTTANGSAGPGAGNAAVEKVNETDAVACEVVDTIFELAVRKDPTYTDTQAWAVARRLACAALVLRKDAEKARELLLGAAASRKLARAENPIGLLIRGVMGNENGGDRFLVPANTPGFQSNGSWQIAQSPKPTAARASTPSESPTPPLSDHDRRADKAIEAQAVALLDTMNDTEVLQLREKAKASMGNFGKVIEPTRETLLRTLKREMAPATLHDSSSRPSSSAEQPKRT